jgi:hypothetical protein
MAQKRKDMLVANAIRGYLDVAKSGSAPITSTALYAHCLDKIGKLSKVTFIKWTKEGTALYHEIADARNQQADHALVSDADPRSRGALKVRGQALRARVRELEEQLRACLVREAAMIDRLRTKHSFTAEQLDDLQRTPLKEAKHLKPFKSQIAKGGPGRAHAVFHGGV